MITRDLLPLLLRNMNDRKVIILLGTRQVGKTTLLQQLVDADSRKVLWVNGDEPDIRKRFEGISSTQLRAFIGEHTTLVIDEAQRIHDVVLSVKLIYDNYPEIKVLLTGSSVLELYGTIKEPLTGRKWEYRLFPFSYNELQRHFNFFEMQRRLPQWLIYGSYPEVALASPGTQRKALMHLLDSFLFKDVLALSDIRKPTQLQNLLTALAFQVGNEVSYNELAKVTGLDNETVIRYIDLLEQSFIIFRLGALSRNLRNELVKTRKIYFYDNGVRNAVMGNFTELGSRTDVGALWENYLMSERMKRNHYSSSYAHSYFWRTYDQQEIDYIEEVDGRMAAFEFKWNPKRTARFPKTFLKAYPDTETKVITPDNYHEFLSPQEN